VVAVRAPGGGRRGEVRDEGRERGAQLAEEGVACQGHVPPQHVRPEDVVREPPVARRVALARQLLLQVPHALPQLLAQRDVRLAARAVLQGEGLVHVQLGVEELGAAGSVGRAAEAGVRHLLEGGLECLVVLGARPRHPGEVPAHAREGASLPHPLDPGRRGAPLEGPGSEVQPRAPPAAHVHVRHARPLAEGVARRGRVACRLAQLSRRPLGPLAALERERVPLESLLRRPGGRPERGAGGRRRLRGGGAAGGGGRGVAVRRGDLLLPGVEHHQRVRLLQPQVGEQRGHESVHLGGVDGVQRRRPIEAAAALRGPRVGRRRPQADRPLEHRKDVLAHLNHVAAQVVPQHGGGAVGERARQHVVHVLEPRRELRVAQ